MQLNGFIKIHRKLIQWGWYQDNVVKGVFLHFLLTARFDKGNWQGRDILPGQVIVGTEQLAKDLGFTRQQIRTAINKLKSTNEITTETTNKFTIVTLVNWEEYQICEEKSTNEITNSLTNEQPTNNQQITNNQPQRKNDKNVKNDKNIYKTPTLDEVIQYCRERANGVDPQRFIDFYQAKGWMIGKNKMKDWKAAVRTWETKKTKEYKLL